MFGEGSGRKITIGGATKLSALRPLRSKYTSSSLVEDIQKRKNAILLQKCIRKMILINSLIESFIENAKIDSSQFETMLLFASYHYPVLTPHMKKRVYDIVLAYPETDNLSVIVSICNFSYKALQNNSEQLLSKCFFLLSSYTLRTATCSLFEYKSTWMILLQLWNSSEYNYEREECMRLLPSLTTLLASVPETTLHRILEPFHSELLHTSYQSSYISILFQNVFIERVEKGSLSIDLLFKLYRVVLHFLPPQAFITHQPNYETLHFLHQIQMDEEGASSHLNKLVKYWNEQYVRLITIEEDDEWVNEGMVEMRARLLKKMVSNQIWIVFLKQVDREKENTVCITQFILLLSDLLRQYGVSTLPQLFLSLSNTGVLLLVQLVLYHQHELALFLLRFCIQNYSSILLDPHTVASPEENAVFSVFVHLLLFCLYFTSMTADSEPLRTVVPSTFLQPFYHMIIQYCFHLYSMEAYPNTISIVDTAVLKALYLLQPLSSVICLPDFIQNQEIQWPKIHRLKNNPQLAEVMKWVPMLFSFKERIAVFRNSLPSIHEGSSVLLKIHRTNLIGDTYTEFRSMINSNYQFQQRFQIVFFDQENHQESGIDGGGLSREHLTLLLRELFSEKMDLFMETENHEWYPAYVDLDEEKRKQYRFVGQVLGRLLLSGQLCEARLAPFFLNLLVQSPSTFNDIKQRSTALFQSLLHLRDGATEAELADFTMSVDYTNGSNGTLCTYAFQENGDQIPVTRGNVHLYVQYMVQFYLQDSIKQACAWIEMGLRDVLGRMDFSLFDGLSFQLLLCGEDAEISIEDMHAYANIVNPEADDEYEDQFWSVMESLSSEEKTNFLLFTTGVSRPPLNGFRYLQPQLSIRFYRYREDRMEEPRLPTSHTCMNEIVIPYYNSKELLRKNLLLSINESEGYGLSYKCLF